MLIAIWADVFDVGFPSACIYYAETLGLRITRKPFILKILTDQFIVDQTTENDDPSWSDTELPCLLFDLDDILWTLLQHEYHAVYVCPKHQFWQLFQSTLIEVVTKIFTFRIHWKKGKCFRTKTDENAQHTVLVFKRCIVNYFNRINFLLHWLRSCKHEIRYMILAKIREHGGIQLIF